jgi:damage-control phosphatase, subfamily I
MKTALDCIPCFMRQALDAARQLSTDIAFHERILRDALRWTCRMDMNQSPPAFAQHFHRRLREMTGSDDPYRQAKNDQNRMALALLPELEAMVAAAPDPLETAIRLAMAGNVIDLGAKSAVTPSQVHQSVQQALSEPFAGEADALRQALSTAQSILYLADNAGEIVFDRLLIAQLSPARVTLAVRGAPIINDATLADARATGLDTMVAVIDNGSDAPGTILDDCSEAFLRCYHKADLIIAKGQGNFETLSDAPGNIFFFLKAKCPVIAAHVGQPVGTHILACSHAPAAHTGKKSNTIIEQAKHSPGSAGHHQGETNHETT